MRINYLQSLCAIMGIGSILSFCVPAFAQSLPGPADAGRINNQEKVIAPDRSSKLPVIEPGLTEKTPVPDEARNIHFKLKSVRLLGLTVFPEEKFDDIFKPYIDHDISLDAVYVMADTITERYRNAGYFLSLAYVPNQSIVDGIVTIQVVEGYISTVEITESLQNYGIVKQYIEQLIQQRPLKSSYLESFLLRLNDLPGLSFRSVLSQIEKGEPGAVRLTLIPEERKGRGVASFDNFNSRFLGPNEASLSYTSSFLPLQQTSLTGLTDVMPDTIKNATIDHAVVIAPNWKLGVNAALTTSNPGYTLKDRDVESVSKALTFNLDYQLMRQRDQNISLKMSFETKNSTTDILSSPLTRDRLRVFRGTVSYDDSDKWNGDDNFEFTISQGIDGMGATEAGNFYASRAEAKPDFTKLQLSFSRLQRITPDWAMTVSGTGQVASGPLFSSEEYGYGGQSFGRAYDSSEILGDHGLGGAVEVRYAGINSGESFSIQPYAFYDVGVIWNDDTSQIDRTSGASTGAGFRFATEWNQYGNVGLAFPLTRQIETPIYGAESNGPRIILQISQGF